MTEQTASQSFSSVIPAANPSVIPAGWWRESRAQICLSHEASLPHLTNNSRRILLAGGSKESHQDQLSDVRTLDPRLREDDGQGSWHSLALVNALRAIKALNSYVRH